MASARSTERADAPPQGTTTLNPLPRAGLERHQGLGAGQDFVS